MGLEDVFYGAKCARCGERGTRSKLDEIPECEENVLEHKANSEAMHVCPMDGATMAKEVIG